ncbi:diptericin-D-like [Cochliomyia hominivorax]
MYIFYLVLIGTISVTLALPQSQSQLKIPQFYGGFSGTQKQGYNVNINARERIWESQNKRQSLDVLGGYTQPLGKFGNPQYNGGIVYRF